MLPTKQKPVKNAPQFAGNEKTKKGGLRALFRKVWGFKTEKKHSHLQENARRLRQIERGVLRPNEDSGL